MTYKEHFKKNITLAYPVMLSQMGHIMVSLADSVMVGQLGAVPLASVSLSISVFALIMLFGIGVTYGMTPLVAASDGANDKMQGATILKHGIVLNAIVGILLTGITFIARGVMNHLDQDPDVLTGALPYLDTLAYSLLPLMVFQTFRQFAEGLSMTKQAMYISVSGNVLNVILNYLLIYGKFGAPEMGLVGAGWATFISRVVMMIAMTWFFMQYGKFSRYRAVFQNVKFNFSVHRRILKIGVPSGLQYIFEVGAFSAAAIMVGWTGAIPLAAHQIALNLSAITYMTSTGIAAAGTIRVGNQLGRNDIMMLRRAGLTCFVMAAIMMAGFGAIFIVGKSFLPSIYVDDPEVIAVASTLLVIAAFFQISDGVQAVGLGVLRGLADVKVPTVVVMVAFWVISIPLGYVLAFPLGMKAQGIWYGLLTGLSIAAIMHLYRFNTLTKKLIKK